MTPWIPIAAGITALLLLTRKTMASVVHNPTDLGPAALAVAREELGVTEDLGHNDGARIRDYWEGTGLGPPSNWCAAFVRFCLHTAAERFGLPLTIEGSPGAKNTRDQFKAAGRWIPADVLRDHPELLIPGMVPVWDRSVPGRPETSWWGHIGFCSAQAAPNGLFRSIEGNSGAAGEFVEEMNRNVFDPRFLGAGVP